MTSDYCKSCKHVLWMVGIGQGVRCNLYKNEKGQPKLISYINLYDCKYEKIKEEIEHSKTE